MKIKTSSIVGILLLIGIIGTGYIYFTARPSNNSSTVLEGKFVQYAQQLGLNTTQFTRCFETDKYASEIQNDQSDGIASGLQGTPTLFINNNKMLGVSSYSDLSFVIQEALASGEKNTIAVGSNPPKGNQSAQVVIVEFSDFQCPACKAAEPYVQQILQNYAGKIVLYYRNFPLTQLHPFAEKAAEASECANEQGKFWEYHDLLFQNQQEWSSG